MTDGVKGQPGVRQDGNYKRNHARLLPSERLQIVLSDSEIGLSRNDKQQEEC